MAWDWLESGGKRTRTIRTSFVDCQTLPLPSNLNSFHNMSKNTGKPRAKRVKNPVLRTVEAPSANPLNAVLEKYVLARRTVFVEDAVIRPLEKVQRPINQDLLNEIKQSYKENGIWSRGSSVGTLHAVLFSELPSRDALLGAVLGFFIGQHRILALQQALKEGLIEPEEGWYDVVLYKKGV